MYLALPPTSKSLDGDVQSTWKKMFIISPNSPENNYSAVIKVGQEFLHFAVASVIFGYDITSIDLIPLEVIDSVEVMDNSSEEVLSQTFTKIARIKYTWPIERDVFVAGFFLYSVTATLLLRSLFFLSMINSKD